MKKGKSPESINGLKTALVSHLQPHSALAEAYRTLRTNLSFASVDGECRLIQVTSPGPNDGKSTTSANISIVLAQAGHKVLLVDCDLRKPTMHKIFEIDNNEGFTNVLVQGRDPLELAKEGPVEGLKILTSGPIPPNPAELLGSERVKELWPQLLEDFDYIILDTPPVLAVTDSVLLAAQAHGVVLVVWAGAERVDIAREAKEQLLKANARILGVVLNKVRLPGRESHYYYYYGGKEQKQVRL